MVWPITWEWLAPGAIILGARLREVNALRGCGASATEEREGTTRLSGIAKEFLAKVASSLRDSNRTHSCIDEFSESVTLELMSKSRAATQLGLIPLEVIERRIYFIRTHKVMLDSDLAELYGVRTKRLNEQVKRNIDRFPADFMFRLNQEDRIV